MKDGQERKMKGVADAMNDWCGQSYIGENPRLYMSERFVMSDNMRNKEILCASCLICECIIQNPNDNSMTVLKSHMVNVKRLHSNAMTGDLYAMARMVGLYKY